MGTSALILPPQRKLERSFERQLAASAAAALAAGGLLWVFVTDVLLYTFVNDVQLIARIETVKGWVSVALALLLVFICTRRIAQRMMRTRAGLSAVADNIADGVLLLDRHRRVEYANPAAKRMLRCEHLVGMSAADLSRRLTMSHADRSIVPQADYGAHALPKVKVSTDSPAHRRDRCLQQVRASA
jgi:PAS domain-containing protein